MDEEIRLKGKTSVEYLVEQHVIYRRRTETNTVGRVHELPHSADTIKAAGPEGPAAGFIIEIYYTLFHQIS